ncbi:unnamed protein product [Alopecurus aequalis]
MAEFALGLTKTAVEGTVSRVKLAIEEEAKLKVRVQNDLVFITGEFQMMQSFLNVANKERTKNEVVRTWVRQIRDLAFDVEDCVELVVSLDTKSGWSWLWYMLPSCVTPSRPLDEVVAKIERLKARVADVSQRNTRYNLIGDSGSGSGSNSYKTALVTTVSSPELMLPPTSDASASSAAFHILREVWEAAGKMRPDMADLKRLITNEGTHREVISLWGSPGSPIELGTTAIVQKVYNDPEICQEFKIRAWVKLMHPFNLEEFLKTFLTQLYAISPHNQENLEPCFRTSKEYHPIKAKLMKQLNQQRYLIIVEQLSTIVEWDAIRLYLPDNKNGSRIVVTTQQLGVALSCTGKPYQVSDLRQFSEGQSLCAFFNKIPGRQSDMGELTWQLRCGGVVSMWSCVPTDSTILDEVYAGITHKSKGFEGVEFERHNWVDVPDPFDLGVFSRRLFLNFHSDDLRAKEIIAAGMLGDAGVIQGCRYFMRQYQCFVVMNGLNSTEDWDMIKAAFLSEPTKGCILVIARNGIKARYTVGEDYQVFLIEDLDDDMLLRRSTEGCKYYGIEANEASSGGRFFYNRQKEARDWMDKFELIVGPDEEYSRELWDCLQYPGVISLCGIAGAWKSSLAMKIYYGQMIIAEDDMPPKHGTYDDIIVDLGFTKYSWVNVPRPFNLMDLCLRLFLDFYSDDVKAKETAAFRIMEGRQDPIEGCLKLLRQYKCFVVIDGLRSKEDWDLIKDALLFEPTKGCILVIAEEKSLATHCVHEENRVIFINGKETGVASHPLIKKKTYSDRDKSRTFSSRMIEARHWTKKVELVGRESEPIPFFYSSLHHVYSVWGFAGVGKSAIVRSRYFKHMIRCQNHTTKFGWVDVPETFSLTDLCRRLLVDLHSSDLESKESTAVGILEGQDPIQGCCKVLQEGNYIVVIDGLRSTNEWDLIKAAFLSEPIKGSLVIITNEESVAKHCVDQESYHHVNIKGLEADAALNLYTKIAWNGKQLTWDQEVLSRLTTIKCGGLPKVIAAIGEYHQKSYPRSIYYGSRRQWLESVNSNFMEQLESTPSLRGLYSWVQSYFDDCPDSLKPCIFYLSIFPSGHGIRPSRLLRRWIAEGYSRDTPGRTAAQNGAELFYELSKLSIIQHQHSTSKATVWQVNGFFREYIISREMQDNLVFELEGRCSLNTQHVGQHLTISSTWDRDKLVFESMELSCLRSLTVFGKWRSFFISANANMKLLRVLDLEDASDLTDGDLEQIGKLLPHLKFLSLRGCRNITCLPSSLGCLRQLQTLDIKGTSIVTMPPAIMKLEKLQYIRAGATRCIATSSEDDNDTVAGVSTPAGADGDGASTSQAPAAASAAKPPAAYGDGASTSQPPPPPAAAAGADDEARTSTRWRRSPRGGFLSSWLSKLGTQGLGISNNDGVQFSAIAARGIDKFTALHTLGVVNVGGEGGNIVLRELRKLTQLRKLGLSGISRKNWHDLCSILDGHGHLVSLSVRLDPDKGVCCLGDISKPPITLWSLKLYGGNIHVSPVWMKQLERLRKVDLGDNELTISTQEDIDSLMELRCMRNISHLCLKPIRDGELYYGLSRLSLSGRDFKACKVLKIDCGGYRLALRFGYDMPQYVEVLLVYCSTNESSLVVSGLANLLSLREVWLKGSYSEAVKQHLQHKVDQHKNKPVLKLD